ncbi:hypothetical protein [Bacillus sp. FJAT-45066]|uniref:hypothetical protein n=1 Tax=Bacillus sp. FJAT-45066 TaxID=2011010 RepID=UPI000BB95E5A|nr:hypothetical protein [Bacillus sp. FJAT-45066]
MVVNLKSKHYAIFIASVLVSILSIVYFYYTVYSANQLELNRIKQNITMENQLIEILESDRNSETPTDGSSTDLQRKLPVAPYVEQFVLQVEEVAKNSQANVTNLLFSSSIPTETTLEEYMEYREDMDEEENTEMSETTNTAIAMPNGIEKLTVNLLVEVNNYSSLKRFLELLEGSTRITQIETVSFSGNAESLSFTVTASTYYHPHLTDLMDELPPLSIPNPSNKTNPFSGN